MSVLIICLAALIYANTFIRAVRQRIRAEKAEKALENSEFQLKRHVERIAAIIKGCEMDQDATNRLVQDLMSSALGYDSEQLKVEAWHSAVMIAWSHDDGSLRLLRVDAALEPLLRQAVRMFLGSYRVERDGKPHQDRLEAFGNGKLNFHDLFDESVPLAPPKRRAS